MKNIQQFKYAVSVIIAVLAVACAGNIAEINAPDVEVKIAENSDYEVIRSLGFQTEGIVEEEDLYVVEGDILLTKTYIDSLRRLPITRQAHKEILILKGQVNGIRVKITSNNIPDPEWRAAVREAVEIWNNVENCPVYFYKIEQEILPHNVRVYMSDKPTVADATPPNWGTPGDIVRINPNIDYYNDTHEEKVYILVHEFGHILGLSHTDFIANGESTADNFRICVTPETEKASVMDSHSAGRAWGDFVWNSWGDLTSGCFTNGDLAAIQVMYGTPIWSQSINGPAECLSAIPGTYTLNLGTNLINLDVSWYVNNVLTHSSTSFNFSPASLPMGQTTVKAVVNYGGVNYEASKVVNVFRPGISGEMHPKEGVNYTYTASSPITGARFTGWTITPSNGYTITGSTTNLSLTVRFGIGNIYTLKANYDVPGTSVTTSASLKFDLKSPPATPRVIPTNPTQTVDPLGYDDATVYWSPPGQTISFTTLNYDPAATYNWMSSFAPMYYTGATYTITPPSNSSSGISLIMCQATKSGLESEGSYVYLYVSSTYPTSGSIAMKKLVEKLDELERDGARLKEMRKRLSDYSASKAASQTQAAQ